MPQITVISAIEPCPDGSILVRCTQTATSDLGSTLMHHETIIHPTDVVVDRIAELKNNLTAYGFVEMAESEYDKIAAKAAEAFTPSAVTNYKSAIANL